MMFCIQRAAGWDRPALPTTLGYTGPWPVHPEVVGDRVVVVTQTALSAVVQAAQPAGRRSEPGAWRSWKGLVLHPPGRWADAHRSTRPACRPWPWQHPCPCTCHAPAKTYPKRRERRGPNGILRTRRIHRAGRRQRPSTNFCMASSCLSIESTSLNWVRARSRL